VDGAFAGRADLVESEFAKAMIAGTYPGVIISAAQRQAAWLHKSALAIADGQPASAVLAGGHPARRRRAGGPKKRALPIAVGQPASAVLDGGYPRLHFSRKPAVETALRNFSVTRLAAIIEQLPTCALAPRKPTTHA